MIDGIVREFHIERWQGPIEESVRALARTALERGQLLVFPQLAFKLETDEQRFLTPKVADGKAKNISLDPVTGRLQGMSVSGDEERGLTAMIERFGSHATAFVSSLLGYKNIERARTSYRPVEVEGRIYSPIKDDRLLHVDAFPSRPMRGRRILRFFSNISPSRPRSWEIGEPFETFAERFLPRVHTSLRGKSWIFEKLGVTRGRRALYDELMLGLHDSCKRDSGYQKNGPHTALSFPPGTSWLVYTDQVLHAALGGAFALEQTFHLDIDQMSDPARSPLKVLERMRGQALV